MSGFSCGFFANVRVNDEFVVMYSHGLGGSGCVESATVAPTPTPHQRCPYVGGTEVSSTPANTLFQVDS